MFTFYDSEFRAVLTTKNVNTFCLLRTVKGTSLITYTAPDGSVIVMEAFCICTED
jgi:hypothetical protein